MKLLLTNEALYPDQWHQVGVIASKLLTENSTDADVKASVVLTEFGEVCEVVPDPAAKYSLAELASFMREDESTQSNLCFALNTEDLVIGREPYHVWIGDAGYDTRPYVQETRERLPVAYWEGNACNHAPSAGDVPAGDVLGFVSALRLGSIIVVPVYYGCHFEGNEKWMRTHLGWEFIPYDDCDDATIFS